MKTSYEFPRITTRGNYNLWNGEWTYKKTSYRLYPIKKFDKIHKAEELVIFVHGMRNTRYGAKKGGLALRRKLRELGYKKHPVVSFSYDADVRGAHIEEKYHEVLKTATIIAMSNGIIHLSRYIMDLKEINPDIKIRLVGHSLGCDVIRSCASLLGKIKPKGYIHSIHLLGSPVETNKIKQMLKSTYKLVNYYNPKDDVIKEGVTKGIAKKPSCLNKMKPKHGLVQKRIFPKNHGFKAHVEKLRKFP